MLDEMRALVALADVGSFTRAAIQLSVTPSAATRMVQRLETSLHATLLDRTVKPPRFTAVGRSALQHCRTVLACVDDLNASVDPDAEPCGELRIGVSPALADTDLAAPFSELRERFPRLTLRLSSDFATILIQQLLDGELHAAVVPVPHSYRAPRSLQADTVAIDEMQIVSAADSPARHATTLQALDGSRWVLYPPGCLLRAALLEQLSAAGLDVTITAEVHNPHLQASLVAGGYGLGLLPTHHLKAHRGGLVPLDLPGLAIPMTIALLRSAHPGRNETAVTHFGQALTAKLGGRMASSSATSSSAIV